MKSEKHIKQNKHIKHNSRQTPAFIVLACALFLSLAVTKPVLADVLASAGFDEGYSLGVVAGQSGASDVGFANGSSWSNHNPVSVIDAVSGNGTDLTYTTPDGGVISSGSHVLHYTAATETAAALFLRALGTPVTGQDVFISFVFSPVHGAEAPNSFFNFFITDNANSTHDGYGVGMYNGSKLGAGVGLDMFADPRTQAIPDPPVTPANGTIYHLVASLKWNEETSLYDSVSFWLNPTRDSFGTPDAEASQSTNLTGSFTRVGIRVANINNGSEYLFDSFIVATEWSDVVPEGVGPSVPEPATWALIFASAGFVLTILKRSQRKQ